MPSQDAFTMIRGLLLRYGLGSLADWAWKLITANKSPAEIEFELRERPEFRTRFSAIFEREARGLAPMSPDEVIAYENTVRQLARAFDVPTGFMDQERINRLIVGDIAPTEVQTRMQLFAQAAFEVPAEVRNQLRSIYGVQEGEIAAFFMDEERGLQLIQRKFVASQVAATAERQRFGQLTREEAERLGGLVTPEQAEAGFRVLQQAQELFQPLPGTSEELLTRETQLGVVAGDIGAQEAVERRARRRQAVFEAGGQFATTEAGITGLGTAQR